MKVYSLLSHFNDDTKVEIGSYPPLNEEKYHHTEWAGIAKDMKVKNKDSCSVENVSDYYFNRDGKLLIIIKNKQK